MGVRSEVAFEIQGPHDKLDFLRRWAEDLFSLTDVPEEDEFVQLYGDEWSLRWFCESIKWYDFDPYMKLDPTMRQFKDLWALADYWGCNGSFIEIYEDGTTDDDFINGGLPTLQVLTTITKDW